MQTRVLAAVGLTALLISGLFLESSRWAEASHSPVAALSPARGHGQSGMLGYIATRNGRGGRLTRLVRRRTAALASTLRAGARSFRPLDLPSRPPYLLDTDFRLTGTPFTSPYLQSEGAANGSNGPYNSFHPGHYAGLIGAYQGRALVGDTTFEYQGSGFDTALSANAAYQDAVGYLGPRSAVPLTDCTSDITHDPCTIGGTSDGSNSSLYVVILVGKCLAETSGAAPDETWSAVGDSITTVIANNAVELEDQERSMCSGPSSTPTPILPTATPVPTSKPAPTSTPLPTSTATPTATSVPTSPPTVIPTAVPPAVLDLTVKGAARVGKEATLTVTVRNGENGQLVRGATVTMDGHGAGISKVTKASTGRNGVVKFSRVHPRKKGVISFRASAAGFKDGTARIRVKR